MAMKPRTPTPQDVALALALLPGLEHARSLLDVAIQVLHRYANAQPASARRPPLSEAAKAKKLLSSYGRLTGSE